MRKRRLITREDFIREIKSYKPTKEFKRWLKIFMKEDGPILDELARRDSQR